MALTARIGTRLEARVESIQTANKAQPLTSAAEKDETVTLIKLKADPANAGTVFVGNRTNTTYPLAAGAELSLEISRQSQVFIMAAAVGYKVHVLVVRDVCDVS